MHQSYTTDKPKAPQGKDTEQKQSYDNKDIIKFEHHNEIIAKRRLSTVLQNKDGRGKHQPHISKTDLGDPRRIRRPVGEHTTTCRDDV